MSSTSSQYAVGQIYQHVASKELAVITAKVSNSTVMVQHITASGNVRKARTVSIVVDMFFDEVNTSGQPRKKGYIHRPGTRPPVIPEELAHLFPA